MEILKNKLLNITVLKNNYEFVERAQRLLFKKDETYRTHFLEEVKKVRQQFRDKAYELGLHDDWSSQFYYNIGTLADSITHKAKIQMAIVSRDSTVSTYKYVNDMHYPDWIAHHIVYALISGKKVRCQCSSKLQSIVTVITAVAQSLNLTTVQSESAGELFLFFEYIL
jgi:hypothetical protein